MQWSITLPWSCAFNASHKSAKVVKESGRLTGLHVSAEDYTFDNEIYGLGLFSRALSSQAFFLSQVLTGS